MVESKSHQVERLKVRQLRGDAWKLETVVRHLWQQARDILAGIKADQTAETVRANFYSKQSKADPRLILTPDLRQKATPEGELFKSENKNR